MEVTPWTAGETCLGVTPKISQPMESTTSIRAMNINTVA